MLDVSPGYLPDVLDETTMYSMYMGKALGYRVRPHALPEQYQRLMCALAPPHDPITTNFFDDYTDAGYAHIAMLSRFHMSENTSEFFETEIEAICLPDSDPSKKYMLPYCSQKTEP